VKKYQRVLLFVLLFGTMLIFGLIENIKGVSFPLIQEEFTVSWEQLGLLVSLLSMAYVGFSIMAGIFLGRFGIKPAILFGFAALCAGLVSVFFMPGFFWTGSAIFVVFAGFGFFEIGINALASRLFIKKTALLMSLLHSFYGIGAVFGPRMAGVIADNTHFGWRYAYLFSIPLALILFIMAVFTRFPADNTEHLAADPAAADRRKTFFDALRSPLVWLMSVTLGLAIVVEMNSSNWGPMYFRDVYGFNPSTDGATFLSAFFLVFTVSRLISGLFIEKIGYIRALLGAVFIVLAIFITGFFLGEKGIFILPAQGFFVAILWPTIMAVAIKIFGRDAPVFSSAMIAIGGLLNGGIQYLIGLTNKIFGPAWGYRSTIVYTVLLIIVLIMLYNRVRRQGTAQVSW
jgi:fucose permease